MRAEEAAIKAIDPMLPFAERRRSDYAAGYNRGAQEEREATNKILEEGRMNRFYLIVLETEEEFDSSPVDELVTLFFDNELPETLEGLGIDGSANMISGWGHVAITDRSEE